MSSQARRPGRLLHLPGLMRYLLDLDRAGIERLAFRLGLDPASATAATLYAELTDLWSVAWVLETLSPRARLAAETVAFARQHTLSWAQLALQLPLAELDLEAACQEAAATGILQGRPGPGGALWTVPDEVAECLSTLARAAGSADPSTAPLRSLLDSLPSPELQRLAARWGIADADVRLRREVTADLEQRLTSREAARAVAATLSPTARRVLTALVRAGGRLEVSQLREQTGVDEPGIRGAARELMELFFARQSFAGGRRALFVPIGVGTLEADEVPPPPVLAPVAGPALPPPAYRVMWDLLTLVAQFARGQPRLSRLPLGEVQARRLAPLLRDQAGPLGLRLAFLSGMARGLGLLVEREGEVVPSAVEEWEGLDFAQQTLRAYRWWLGSERWREGLSPGERDTGGPLAFTQGRTRLVAALTQLTPEAWYPVDVFLAHLRQREPLLFRDRGALEDHGGQQAFRRVAAYWDRWDGKVARGALTLSLAWLEAVAVAEVGGVPCLAVTGLGRWLFGQREAQAPVFPAAPPVALDEDGMVRVRWPDARAVAALLRIGRPLPGDEPRYAIDRHSVVAATAAGVDVERALTILEPAGLGGTVLPAAVRAWAAQVRRFTAFTSVVLVAESGEAMDRLMDAPGYLSLRLRRVGPRHALVGDEAELQRALERLSADGFVVVRGAGHDAGV